MPPTGHNPQYLQSVVSSGKIYIRPLQKDLDLKMSIVALHGQTTRLVLVLKCLQVVLYEVLEHEHM